MYCWGSLLRAVTQAHGCSGSWITSFSQSCHFRGREAGGGSNTGSQMLHSACYEHISLLLTAQNWSHGPNLTARGRGESGNGERPCHTLQANPVKWETLGGTKVFCASPKRAAHPNPKRNCQQTLGSQESGLHGHLSPFHHQVPVLTATHTETCGDSTNRLEPLLREAIPLASPRRDGRA